MQQRTSRSSAPKSQAYPCLADWLAYRSVGVMPRPTGSANKSSQGSASTFQSSTGTLSSFATASSGSALSAEWDVWPDPDRANKVDSPRTARTRASLYPPPKPSPRPSSPSTARGRSRSTPRSEAERGGGPGTPRAEGGSTMFRSMSRNDRALHSARGSSADGSRSARARVSAYGKRRTVEKKLVIVNPRWPGIPLDKIRAAGYTAFQLRAVGYPATEMREAGYQANELRWAGFHAAELREARYRLSELKRAGDACANPTLLPPSYHPPAHPIIIRSRPEPTLHALVPLSIHWRLLLHAPASLRAQAKHERARWLICMRCPPSDESHSQSLLRLGIQASR